jgi:hypothetical protein
MSWCQCTLIFLALVHLCLWLIFCAPFFCVYLVLALHTSFEWLCCDQMQSHPLTSCVLFRARIWTCAAKAEPKQLQVLACWDITAAAAHSILIFEFEVCLRLFFPSALQCEGWFECCKDERPEEFRTGPFAEFSQPGREVCLCVCVGGWGARSERNSMQGIF